jgi:DNA-binding NarL/FixJ family response regulator
MPDTTKPTDATKPPTPAAAVHKEPVTVLLVDGQPLVRIGLRAVLAGEPDMCVVGECGGAAAALEMAVALRPRVVIVDLLGGPFDRLGTGGGDDGGSGFGLIRDLRVQSRATAVLVCASACVAAQTIRHLLAIGARGYLHQGDAPRRLARAVRKVAGGRRYLDADLAGDAVASDAATADDENGADPMARRGERLSGCELEVLHLIGFGYASAAIASTLHKSIKTIQTYRSRIVRKLGLNGATGLTQLAWRLVHPSA